MEFEVETTVPATAKVTFEAWLDSDQHSEMTGAPALITPDEGDEFSAWDGYIWGTTLEIKPYSFIKQTWRTADFTEGQENSLVEIHFKDTGDDQCLVRIVHTSLSETDDHYIQGWEDFYFSPMIDYFSHAGK